MNSNNNNNSNEKVIKDLLSGNRKTIAKLISSAENSPNKAMEITDSISPHIGKAYIIGITGPPGCGKSTLAGKLALQFRKSDKQVDIIAVDPSSVSSGGAFMGNRVRMSDASKDSGIFIRSMGSRGSLGGLSKATSMATKILDAAGMDYIIIETVGAGQVQTDIVSIAYTVIVVIQPKAGDIIQAAKAGLMEIGDIFIINKSDLTGANKTANDLIESLSMSHYIAGNQGL